MNHLCKVGARGHDIGELSTIEIISYCKKHSITGLQLVVNKTWPELFVNQDFAGIKSEVEKILSNGIEIYLLGCYFNPVHPNKESLSNDLNRVAFVLKLAKELNLPYIGSETGSYNGDKWTYSPLNHTTEALNEVKAVFSGFEKELAPVEFLIEPVYDHVVFNVKQQISLQSELNNQFASTLDICNLLHAKNCDSCLNIMEDAFLSLNNIKLLHLKNFNLVDGQKVGCRLDAGLINYEVVVDLIFKHKMQDIPIIVEELSGEDLEESVKYIKNLYESKI